MAAIEIKVELSSKFDGVQIALTIWCFFIKQHCKLVSPQNNHDYVSLKSTILLGQALVWWYHVVARDPNALVNLDWDDFLSRLKEAFRDIDKEIRFRRKLQSICQNTSMQQCIKVSQGIVL